MNDWLPAGEWGPCSMKKFGNPGMATVRWQRGPSAHAWSRVTPSRPVIAMGRMKRWAWNPVARTSTSSSWTTPSAVSIPSGTTRTMSSVTTSTRSRWTSR